MSTASASVASATSIAPAMAAAIETAMAVATESTIMMAVAVVGAGTVAGSRVAVNVGGWDVATAIGVSAVFSARTPGGKD
jgi:hypothetical protein